LGGGGSGKRKWAKQAPAASWCRYGGQRRAGRSDRAKKPTKARISAQTGTTARRLMRRKIPGGSSSALRAAEGLRRSDLRAIDRPMPDDFPGRLLTEVSVSNHPHAHARTGERERPRHESPPARPGHIGHPFAGPMGRVRIWHRSRGEFVVNPNAPLWPLCGCRPAWTMGVAATV